MPSFCRFNVVENLFIWHFFGAGGAFLTSELVAKERGRKEESCLQLAILSCYFDNLFNFYITEYRNYDKIIIPVRAHSKQNFQVHVLSHSFLCLIKNDSYIGINNNNITVSL